MFCVVQIPQLWHKKLENCSQVSSPLRIHVGPWPQDFFSKSCSFQAILRDFEHILGSVPSLGIKTLLGLPLTKILDPPLSDLTHQNFDQTITLDF